MIKIDKVDVLGWDSAIRGMRNTMNSWDKSDSGLTIMNPGDVEYGYEPNYEFVVGENDLKLMKSLVKAGSDHRKFLRYIFVSVDIKAPLYWWKEYDTYKVGTVANSCSTMHKIHAKEFTLDDFSHEHLDPLSLSVLEKTIENLNINREMFINYDQYKGGKPEKKNLWWQMIQLLPSSYNQLRTCTVNYEVLLNMYHARKAHKLDEWIEFCKWVETLPYFKEICLED